MNEQIATIIGKHLWSFYGTIHLSGGNILTQKFMLPWSSFEWSTFGIKVIMGIAEAKLVDWSV